MGNAESVDPAEGAQFGRYTLQVELGSGSFGTVYQAAVGVMRRKVAVKVFAYERRDFAEREIEVLKAVQRIRCPQIISMAACTKVGRFTAIEFPLLYKSVYDVQRDRQFKGYSFPVVVMITKSVVLALAALHNLGFAHADVKPENVMFTTPACAAVKLIDFGLARKSPCGQATYIQSRYYRAPETVLGVGSTVAMDMWSLGCMVPELYTGRALFKADCEEHLVAMHKGINDELPLSMLQNSVRSRRFFERVGGACAVDLPATDTQYGDFVAKCIVVNPSSRMNARDALSHPFLDMP